MRGRTEFCANNAEPQALQNQLVSSLPESATFTRIAHILLHVP